MDAEKKAFLQSRFIPLLKELPSDRKPAWGKMTVPHMIEHFSDAVKVASGKIRTETILTLPENRQKMQHFLMSDKPFRENTPNPLLPDVPGPVRHQSIEEAISELENEVAYFFQVFEANPHLTTRNPFFGDLDFDRNVQLLHKHALHHLRQFGVEPVAEGKEI